MNIVRGLWYQSKTGRRQFCGDFRRIIALTLLHRLAGQGYKLHGYEGHSPGYLETVTSRKDSSLNAGSQTRKKTLLHDADKTYLCIERRRSQPLTWCKKDKERTEHGRCAANAL